MNTKAPLRTPTSSGGRPPVVGRDLSADLGHASTQLLGGDDGTSDPIPGGSGNRAAGWSGGELTLARYRAPTGPLPPRPCRLSRLMARDDEIDLVVHTYGGQLRQFRSEGGSRVSMRSRPALRATRWPPVISVATLRPAATSSTRSIEAADGGRPHGLGDPRPQRLRPRPPGGPRPAGPRRPDRDRPRGRRRPPAPARTGRHAG